MKILGFLSLLIKCEHKQKILGWYETDIPSVAPWVCRTEQRFFFLLLLLLLLFKTKLIKFDLTTTMASKYAHMFIQCMLISLKNAYHMPKPTKTCFYVRFCLPKNRHVWFVFSLRSAEQMPRCMNSFLRRFHCKSQHFCCTDFPKTSHKSTQNLWLCRKFSGNSPRYLTTLAY